MFSPVMTISVPTFPLMGSTVVKRGMTSWAVSSGAGMSAKVSIVKMSVMDNRI